MAFTNKLINETSPYLLQHAHNPVDWYPWGKEAFQKAADENKPIFLSVGYSTCHWCHVMEHESFENPEVAQFLNEHFVAIKVDKEERPDIDSIYMSVCQAMTGNGGWPMTILMTPEQKPFYAATYLPKRNRYNMPGLLDLLPQVSRKWQMEREAVERSADSIIDFIKKSEAPGVQRVPSCEIIKGAYGALSGSFDKEFGGFGKAPKFPMAHELSFLMQYYQTEKEEYALEMAEKTLIQLYKGGIFDHIGFGFSRYSTDRKWLVPHFEKMLYDNALLIMAYAQAFEITGNDTYKEIITKTVSYIFRELGDEKGGFYCAQDADSEGVEGKYYVFKPTEIKSILGDSIGDEFNKVFDITERGNFEGNSIPNLISSSDAHHEMGVYIPQIYAYRKSRYALHLDDKILTSWNGLMIAALAVAYGVVQDKEYLKKAEEASGFIKDHLTQENRVFTSYRNGKRTATGFIDDYSFYIFGLLELYRATSKKEYLDDALKFTKRVIEEFYDHERGGFYLYGQSAEKLLMRPKETYDGAIPSGNSVMASNLFYLSQLTGKDEYERLVRQHFGFMVKAASGYPSGHSFFMTVLLMGQGVGL